MQALWERNDLWFLSFSEAGQILNFLFLFDLVHAKTSPIDAVYWISFSLILCQIKRPPVAFLNLLLNGLSMSDIFWQIFV